MLQLLYKQEKGVKMLEVFEELMNIDYRDIKENDTTVFKTFTIVSFNHNNINFEITGEEDEIIE